MAVKRKHKAERFIARKQLDTDLSGILDNKKIAMDKIEYLRDQSVTLKAKWEEDGVDALDLAELTDQIDYFNALLDV